MPIFEYIEPPSTKYTLPSGTTVYLDHITSIRHERVQRVASSLGNSEDYCKLVITLTGGCVIVEKVDHGRDYKSEREARKLQGIVEECKQDLEESRRSYG